MATGDLSTTFEPLNGAAPAALGGSFAGEATYETEIYFNRVVVLPATLSSLGLSAAEGALRYRGVSLVSRLPRLLGLPADAPLDTTDWVDFDAGAPRLALPGCFEGTPLCPGEGASIELELLGDPAPLPTLLVLHHTNGAAARHESVSLSESALAPTELVVTSSPGGALDPGAAATATFTITNAGATVAPGVTVTLASTSGSIATITPSAGSCAETACDLGDLAAGAAVTIEVSAAAAGPGALSLTASAAAAGSCEADTGDDQASAELTIGSPAGAPEPAAAGGCGCRTAGRPGTATGAAALFVAAGLLARRRRRADDRRPR